MKYPTIIALGLALALTSCSEDPKEESRTSGEGSNTLASLLLEKAPEAPGEIAEMRKSAKPGDSVTFKGALIGDLTIFMESRAVMKMGDPKELTACNLVPGDECETPWDVCCDDPEDIKASIVTVRVLDEDGKIVESGLKGLGGLEELRAVTVTGIVADTSNDENMQINATGIYVHPRSS